MLGQIQQLSGFKTLDVDINVFLQGYFQNQFNNGQNGPFSS